MAETGPKPGPTGPPSPTGKYCARVVNYILDGLAEGRPSKYVAADAGISYSTYLAWQKKYPEFADNVKKAKLKYIKRLQDIIFQRATGQGKGDWKAAAWLLERRYPLDWGPAKETMQLEANAPIQVQILTNSTASPGDWQPRKQTSGKVDAEAEADGDSTGNTK